MTTSRIAHVSSSPPGRAPSGPRLSPDQRRGLEAILFLADEPVDVATLAEAVEAPIEDVEAEVEQLASVYRDDGRGMEIRSAAGGWRMYTAAESHPVVERWALAGRTGRLTQAALETLAVIAYKQPISRHRIGDIRGVNADAAVRSLVARGLVTEVGRDPGPGQAVLYGTTTMLLERLGLTSLDQLRPLTDFLPDAPAPDEPDLGALKEIRRRLARGDEPGDTRSAASAQDPEDGDDDTLPAPAPPPAGPRGGEDIDDLTDRLEAAARKAVDRLRAAVTADGLGSPDAPSDGDPIGDATAADDATEHPDGDERG